MKDSCEITLDITGYFDERKRHATKVNVACGLDIEMIVTLQLHYAPKSPHRNITCQSKILLKPPLIFDCEEMQRDNITCQSKYFLKPPSFLDCEENRNP